jgi:hypothetical protein
LSTTAPQAPAAPPPPVPVERRGGGFAVTALVCGIVGAVFGMIPLLFFLAFPLGLLALVFGVLAWRSARMPGGTRKGMAIAGTVLGCLALALGIAGAVIVDDAVSDLDRDLNQIQMELDSGR